MSLSKGICRIAGCGCATANKGVQDGKVRYRALCAKHHNEKMRQQKKIDRSKCTLCGWTGPCDTHRIKYGCNGGTYTQGNVMVICPNCHRLIHSKQLCVAQQRLDKGKNEQQLLFKIL